MAEFSTPWDSVDEQNPWPFFQEHWRKLWAGMFHQVSPYRKWEDEGETLVATGSQSDRTITVSPGLAIVQGHLYESDDDIVLESTPPPSGQQKIDLVVLRLDPSEPPETRIRCVLLEGNPSPSAPILPPLTRDPEGVWEAPLYSFGPHGTGPMGQAPRSTQTVNTLPIQLGSQASGITERLGLAKIEGAMLFNRSDGRWYHYSRSQDRYVWAQEPRYGSISAAGGWTANTGGRAPRWRLDNGLVTLKGTFFRNGSASAVSLPNGDHGVAFTAALPAAIRPSDSSGRYFLSWARLGTTSSGSTRREPVRLSLDPSTNRLTVANAARDTRFVQPGTTSAVLDGMSWWVE